MRARAGTRMSRVRRALSGRAPEEEVRRIVQAPGRQLAPPLRADMEARFGADFSGVRVHDDRDAAASARSLDARAYTFGDHVVFGAGEYAPHTAAGRRLIAHELAHTVQQGRAGAANTVQRTPFPGETEAHWLYLTKDPVPKREVKGTREDYGVGLSEWLVVKDPEKRPQEWVRLTGYDPIDGEIGQLRSDRRGYYYYWYGRKIYLPKYPAH
jgi:hypothetical protein